MPWSRPIVLATTTLLPLQNKERSWVFQSSSSVALWEVHSLGGTCLCLGEPSMAIELFFVLFCVCVCVCAGACNLMTYKLVHGIA